jgi:hypothetical protein
MLTIEGGFFMDLRTIDAERLHSLAIEYVTGTTSECDDGLKLDPKFVELVGKEATSVDRRFRPSRLREIPRCEVVAQRDWRLPAGR